MWFLTFATWISFLVQLLFFTIGLAAALYYIAELIEEYTLLAAKCIRILIMSVLAIHIGFLLFEELPVYLNVIGLTSQIIHFTMMRSFPVFYPLSPSFISAIILSVINHYFAFSFFGEVYHPFSEVLAYFVLCLWLVPFSFFVSLSANDQTLPVTSRGFEEPITDFTGTNGTDVVSNYLSSSQKKKKYGLLSLFQYTKDWLIPGQRKRFS